MEAGVVNCGAYSVHYTTSTCFLPSSCLCHISWYFYSDTAVLMRMIESFLCSKIFKKAQNSNTKTAQKGCNWRFCWLRKFSPAENYASQFSTGAIRNNEIKIWIICDAVRKKLWKIFILRFLIHLERGNFSSALFPLGFALKEPWKTLRWKTGAASEH